MELDNIWYYGGYSVDDSSTRQAITQRLLKSFGGGCMFVNADTRLAGSDAVWSVVTKLWRGHGEEIDQLVTGTNHPRAYNRTRLVVTTRIGWAEKKLKCAKCTHVQANRLALYTGREIM